MKKLSQSELEALEKALTLYAKISAGKFSAVLETSAAQKSIKANGLSSNTEIDDMFDEAETLEQKIKKLGLLMDEIGKAVISKESDEVTSAFDALDALRKN
jgi:septal ring factor EnvC (AmiA/AmiB activator)